jgi:hypothetical protein
MKTFLLLALLAFPAIGHAANGDPAALAAYADGGQAHAGFGPVLNGGADSKGGFTIVPEPAVALLGGIGLLILLLRRK